MSRSRFVDARNRLSPFQTDSLNELWPQDAAFNPEASSHSHKNPTAKTSTTSSSSNKLTIKPESSSKPLEPKLEPVEPDVMLTKSSQPPQQDK